MTSGFSAYTHTSTPKYFLIRSKMNGKVLDIQGAKANTGTPVVTWPRKNPPANNQLWYLDQDGIIKSKLNNLAFKNNGRSDRRITGWDAGI